MRRRRYPQYAALFEFVDKELRTAAKHRAAAPRNPAEHQCERCRLSVAPCMVCSRSSFRASMRRAYPRAVCPASVSFRTRPCLRKSGVPSSSCRRFICRLIAAGVRPRRSAACAKPPRSWAVMSVRRMSRSRLRRSSPDVRVHELTAYESKRATMSLLGNANVDWRGPVMTPNCLCVKCP